MPSKATTKPRLVALFSVLLLLVLADTSSALTVPIENKADPPGPRYLSSTRRTHEPRSYGLFSYDRHEKRVGRFDPLENVRDVLVHQGTLPEKRNGQDFLESMASQGDSIKKPDGSTVGPTIMSLNPELDPSQGLPSDAVMEAIQVLGDTQQRYLDKVLWRPNSNHEDQRMSGVNLEKRRKNKHKDDDDYDDDGQYRSSDYGDGGDRKGKSRNKSKSKNKNKSKGGGAYAGDGSGKGPTYAAAGNGGNWNDPAPNDRYSASGLTRNGQDYLSQSSSKGNSDDHRSSAGVLAAGTKSLKDDCQALQRFYNGMVGSNWINRSGWSSTDGSGKDCCTWYGVTCHSSLTKRRKQKHDDEYGDDYDYGGSAYGGDYAGGGDKWDDGQWSADKYDSKSSGKGAKHDDFDNYDDRPSGPPSGLGVGPYTVNGETSGGGGGYSGGSGYDGGSGSSTGYRGDSATGSGGGRSSGKESGSKKGSDRVSAASTGGGARVVGLNLSANGLKGELATALFELDELARIDLSHNGITALPAQFDSMLSLTHLNMANNTMTGTMSPNLLSSPSIVSVDLSNNQLSGPIAIASATLTNLNVEKNRFTTITIDQQAQSLSKLDISSNVFSGPLPDLSHTQLSSFVAMNNHSGALFDISAFPKLTRVDVRQNQLSGSIPSIPQSSILVSLYLGSNNVSGPFPSQPAPPSLTSCYISPNPISPCPSAAEFADPNSLASRCHLKCPGANRNTGQPGFTKTGGIPVSPLPGEPLGQVPVASGIDLVQSKEGQAISAAGFGGLGTNGGMDSAVRQNSASVNNNRRTSEASEGKVKGVWVRSYSLIGLTVCVLSVLAV